MGILELFVPINSNVFMHESQGYIEMCYWILLGGWVGGWIFGWMGGWMHGWMDGWVMDG